ncbi:adult cuticle protein 1 [Eurosta solidaginis]|uniref:adult cuticle protein 1 n=1 Tax=Eurosta solidaginis TaxID=178769 RepID=UPI003530B6D9
MKFVITVVMLALAAGVHSAPSLLTAQIAPAVSYVTSSLHPGYLGLGHGYLGYGAPYSAWGPAAISAHGHYAGIPGISLAQGPAAHAPIAAPLAVAHDHGHGHGPGVYVAKTLGAVHTAPLAGHINSATSLNLAPAPGTH